MPASQILHGLYIGDIDDAWAAHNRHQIDVMINVLENPRTGIFVETSERIPGETWIPIAHDENGWMQADRTGLDKAANAIQAGLKAGKIVMIHCAAGRERSPLTVIWYLHKKRHMTLDDAYKFVKERRRQTDSGILSWL